MRAHKYSLPKFTPRLTAFLLFLSMLLTVFPSYAHAVMPEGEQTDQNSTATQQENVPLQEPIDTQLNTELESSLAEAASVALVVSEPVINNTANTNIMLSNNKVDIEPNETQLLRVQTSLSNVTSISLEVDNPSVLGLGTSGSLLYGEVYVSVIGNNTGIATVTAKVKNGDTVLDTVSIEIYVTMDDGIYLIKNGESHLEGDYYLRPDKLPTAVDPAPPVYGSTNNYWMLENDLLRYYRIQYYGNGKYVIRPLANETYALSLVNGAVSLSSDISDMSLWILQTHGSSYRIIHAGSQNGDGLVFPVGTPLTAIYNNVFLYQYGIPTVRDYDNMVFENWNLIPATVTGIVFRNEKEGTLCSAFSATADLEYGGVYISDFGYKVLAFSGTTTPTLTWSCQQNPGIANIISTTGSITLYRVGTSVLNVGFTVGDTEYTVSFDLEVICRGIGIQNDAAYYIMNVSSNRYLSLANESDADATNTITQPRSTAAVARWRTDKRMNGQYQLVNEYSVTDKVLNVSGTNVNIYTDTNSSNQIFTIERIDDGSGLYYIMNGSLYVAEDSDYNVYLTSTVSEAAKWSFMKADLGQYQLYNFYYLDTSKDPNQTCDTTAYQHNLCIAFEGMGYSYQINKNATPETAYMGLQTSDIFMFFGHGNAGLIAFYNDNGIESGRILAGNSSNTSTRYYMSTLPDNSLASLRCVFYLGCKTANTNDNNTPENTSDDTNLLEATYEKGAHLVFGLTERVEDDNLMKWVECFKNKVLDTTIPLSLVITYTNIQYDDEFPISFIGDTNQYFK